MKKTIFTFFVGLLCMASCETEKGEVPVLGGVVLDKVTTDAITYHVEVTTGEVADCGIYYGVTKNRVINGTSDKVKGTYDGTTIRGEITKLTPNKVYYVKAYGMNEFGISETEVIEVRTASRTPSIDDNKYPNTQP